MIADQPVPAFSPTHSQLLAIHDPNAPLDEEMASTAASPSASRRSTLLTTLAPHSRFLSTLRATSTLRSLEQTLVPWQADEGVLECPICKGAFGYATRRKHHCRACGRVVCGDVVTRCSTNVVRGDDGDGSIKEAPSETQSLEELISSSNGNGNGKSTRSSSGSAGPSTASSLPSLHSPFRLCTDCQQVVHRKRYMQSSGEVEEDLPPYSRLYGQLSALQTQIEQSLPEFQELVMGLQRGADNADAEDQVLGVSSNKSPSTTPAALLQLQRDAASARKQLLTNFANYDLIAKRIRALDDGGNSSLRRIKEAVERKAAAFLQANMFPLQSIPKAAPRNKNQHKRDGSTATTNGDGAAAVAAGASAATASHLAILQEQRDQIASFLSRAQKERKLNDVPLLKRNLDELDREMQRVRREGVQE